VPVLLPVDPLTLHTAVEHRLAPVAPLGPRLPAASGTFDDVATVVAFTFALAALARALPPSLHSARARSIEHSFKLLDISA
jgi:hypothetical protein